MHGLAEQNSRYVGKVEGATLGTSACTFVMGRCVLSLGAGIRTSDGRMMLVNDVCRFGSIRW